MKRLFPFFDGFFFRPVTATGFGLMRAAFGLATLYAFLVQWMDVAEYYAADGFLPPEFQNLAMRSAWRFSLLDHITSIDGVYALYTLLLLSAGLMTIGVWPRLTTILTVFLVFSFHERAPFILSGGDTVLRLIGFLLVIAPGTTAFSFARLEKRLARWKRDRTIMPPQTMPIWPYRMLLWQMIVLYGTATWNKSVGTMWLNGTAVASVLHHPYFTRLPRELVDTLTPILPFVTYGTLLFQTLWLLLLIPSHVRARLVPRRLQRLSLKRFLLILGILFHGSILLFMDAGDFSLVMFAAYAGLLLDEDFVRMRAWLNRGWKGTIAVLYDSHCGFCTRSVFWLHAADWLKRIELVNFHDDSARLHVASDIPFEELDRSMHIKFPNGKTLKGFDAFRALCFHLPPCWPLIPFLWLPGVAPLGRKVYNRISERRKRCSHENCAI